ncbi:MAG: hypothetical protein FJY07_06565 [Bacteroidetes bacterium]|nr:hypothetical protein [Bacteroidota bacterium]
MELTYFCPHCKAAINAKKNIILTAVKQGHKSNKGLVLLHEKIGNYAVVMSASLKIEKGEVVDFLCPVCNKSLNSAKGDNLASFTRIGQTGNESTIVISRIFGEQYTFQISDNKKVTSYGKSVSRFIDPEWFL